MASEVGSGQVSIVPTFKGFRRAVDAETEGAAKKAGSGFAKAFSKTGESSGKATGAGFKKSFESASQGFSAKATKALEQDVAKAARAFSTARLKEQDAAGKARVAEAQLGETRKKYASNSSQVIRAQERYESALRGVDAAQENVEDSSRRLQDAQKDLARAADRAGDEFEESGRKSGGRFTSGFGKFIGGVSIGSFIGNFASNIVSNIGQAISSGFSAGFDFMQESVSQASDLNESANAVAVAYGDAAKSIEDLSKGTATRLGLSQSDFNGFATQFSSFAATIRGNDVGGFIDELTTRGADFASVYNLEVSDALGLFQSGLAGETEPLRKFGIDLSAAAVSAYAYSSGIGTAGTELTEAQKQQARYGLLLEQTSKTQGDFKNTSGELANQQRILGAEFENSQAKLGMALLPAMTQLANIANTTLIPVLNQVIDQVGPLLADSLAEAGPAFADLITAIAPLVPELIRFGAEALPPLIAGLIAISPLLIDWVTNGASVMEMLNGFFAFLNGDISITEFAAKVGGLGGSFIEALRAVGTFVGQGIGNLMNFAATVQTKIDEVVGFVTSLPGRALGALGDLGSFLISSGQDLIQGFIDGIDGMLGGVGDAVGGVLDWAAGFFPNSPAKRGPFSGAGWGKVESGGAALLDQFTSGFGKPDLDFGRLNADVTGSARAIAPGSAGVAGGPAVHQENHFAHEDPRVAADLANGMLTYALRSA